MFLVIFVYSSAVPQVLVLSRRSPSVPGSTAPWAPVSSSRQEQPRLPALGFSRPTTPRRNLSGLHDFPTLPRSHGRPLKIPTSAFPLNAYGLTLALCCPLGHLGQSCGPYIFPRIFWATTTVALRTPKYSRFI